MATAIRKPTYVTIGGASSAGGGNGRPYRPAHRPEVTYMVREPPVVYPYDDAVVHHSFKGDQFEGTFTGGVYNGLGYETSNSGIFTVESGYGSIWGRQFEVTEDYEIDLSALTGIKYCVIYVEVDLEDFTNQSASIKLAYAGAGYPDIDSDNLIESKSGKARMVLYSFLYTANNHGFDDVKTKFYRFSPGVAERARMMLGEGIWNGRMISNLLYYNADRFKKGNHAIFADLGKALGPNGEWVAYSDELEIKHSEETEPRQLLKITSGEFHISGDLTENKSYQFYYSKEAVPVPYGAEVIGVLVSGTMKGRYYETALFSGRGWKDIPGNQYFSAQHHIHDTKIFGWTTGSGHVPVKEGQAMYDGNVWNRGDPLLVQTLLWQADHVIGTETGNRGTVLWNPKQVKVNAGTLKIRSYSYDMRGKIATITFGNRINSKRPYVNVQIHGGFGLVADLHVRLIYILGSYLYGETYAYDNWDTQHQYPYVVTRPIPDENPFSSLDPQLEGGQT